jgi:CubicO group peptidase (beta-lactamase class C family)
MDNIYPGEKWQTTSPEEAGFDPRQLAQAKRLLVDHAGNRAYRVGIVRKGMLVAEWNYVIDRSARFQLASAAKSVFSCMLGIAVAEGKIESADAKVVDYYPEAMDVPEGEGPKSGRHVYEKDRDITFRQLISNTSGYMKPGEIPGSTFHYQTFGMNILAHAISKTYGLYNSDNPRSSPGLKQLIDEKIGRPIGARWNYHWENFALHSKAKMNIFGYYPGIISNAMDMARLGWLWLNRGRWEKRQVVPASWIDEATRVAPDIREHGPPEDQLYGHGFWTNAAGKLWPGLPTDGYAAAGAGNHVIVVFPSQELVIVLNPGLWGNQDERHALLLKYIIESC